MIRSQQGVTLLVFLLGGGRDALPSGHAVQAPGLRKACTLRQQVLRGARAASRTGTEDNSRERIQHALAEGVESISSGESAVHSLQSTWKIRQSYGCRPHRAAPGRSKAVLG